jgi:hypothetical protein
MGNKHEVGKSHVPEVIEEMEEQAKVSEKAKIQMEGPGKDIAESSAQGEARGIALNSGPYCYRCLTRGHPKEECFMNLFYEICESAAHVKGRCPLLKKGKSTYTLTCGYVVDKLDFYYIPNTVVVRPKGVARTAMVRVVESELIAVQVKSEMERLVPAKMTWAVEEIEQKKVQDCFSFKGRDEADDRVGYGSHKG